MSLRAQYPVFGRRTGSFDIRAKWFTAIYDEIRKRIPTELVRLFYVPVSPATHSLYRWQMALLERPEAVTHITTNMHAFLLRRRSRCPTVLTCYDIGPRWTTARLHLADRVIVSAQKIKEELEGVAKLAHEPVVIHLAVPPAYRPADVPRSRSRILVVSTEQKRKNLDGLFRIFARVLRETPATLVKVGVPSPDRPRLRALARELGIENHVEWRDFVNEGDLVRLYQTSTVTVVPSFLEGFSMPCLEAMSTGCPLVASSLSAVPEVVGSGGLLLDPRGEPAWADAIVRIMQDPAVARDLSRRGVERSAAFSAVRSAERVLRVYEEVWSERERG